jgi:hypothetical protein
MVIDKGSPLFEAMGGMHNVYINSTGEAALTKGEPYPDKTVLLVDLHEFSISDGSYVEGMRRRSKPVHLVVDGLPAHTTALVKAYVASTKGHADAAFPPWLCA